MEIEISNVEKDKRLKSFETELAPISEAVAALEIKTEEAEAQAANMLLQIKAKGKELSSLEKSFTDGPKAFVKMVSSIFRPKTDALEALERTIKGKMVSFRNELDRLAAEERRKAEERNRKAAERAEAKGKPAPIATPLPAIAQPSTVRTGAGSVSYSTIKKWRISDPAAIPEEYWILDEARVTKVTRAGAVIPGIEVYEEKIATGRT